MSAAYAIERFQATSGMRVKTEAGLHALLRLVLAGIDELSDGINSGALSIAEWRDAMADALAVGHIAAYQEGRDSHDLGNISRRQLNATLEDQIAYLNNFANEVDRYGWADRSDRARAGLYVGALKQSYWQGATFGLGIPRYPGDGFTSCLGNCTCRLRVVWIDQEELDADVYWELGGAERHCRECPRLAAAWAPLKFRGGKQV